MISSSPDVIFGETAPKNYERFERDHYRRFGRHDPAESDIGTGKSKPFAALSFGRLVGGLFEASVPVGL